jgi:transcriptional regulator with XRE-family HTH domain
MDLLNKILYLISRNQMTELEFTQKVGLNKTAVTEWKRGKTQSFRKHIPKIAAVLEVSEDFLLHDVPENAKFAKRCQELRLENEIPENYGSTLFESCKEDLFAWETLGIIPSKDILEKMSDFYNVSIAYLIGENDIKRPKRELPLECTILIKLRKQHGLTRKELAENIDIPLLQIILFETVNEISSPDLGDYIKLSDFYNVSIDSLLGRERSEQINLTEKKRDMLFLFSRLSLPNQIKSQNYMVDLYEKQERNKELIEKMPDWAENHGDSVAADDLGKTGTDPK